MWSPSSCYRRLIFCLQTSALHLHSLTGNTGLQLPFLPFHSFSLSLWCFFFSSSRPSVPDVFLNAKVGYGIQEGATTNKKAFESIIRDHKILNLSFHANLSPMFHVWTFPLWFVSADLQVFTVTPVSWSSEEVAPNKQHLQRGWKTGPVGFQLDCSKDSELKVLLYADDTELFPSRHWDGQKLKPFTATPKNICS